MNALRPTAPDLDELLARFGGLDGADLLRPLLTEVFPGRIALVSSFGAEAAVLLALVAEIEPATPVVFLDTGKLFPETLEYRDALAAKLGLTDIRSIAPDPADLAQDPEGRLWRADPNRCCYLRKVKPLERALSGFDAWITGRKRFQGGARAALPAVEHDGRHFKVNPLAPWSEERIQAEFESRGLPVHPLVPYGFLSIGCMPCTRPVEPGQSARSGRWAGLAKTECGIHLDPGAHI
ncbi:MAG TPA: phosphoadenylyl-sulfate reductase [Alphaproteobacteria bacterium]|nr:phosphoadenylyl-sulfate reductase [Alphaproteobacteria bacterium]